MSEILKWTDEMAAIEKKRADAKALNLKMEPGKEYKKVCRACNKPNTLSVDFCTGCNFDLRSVQPQSLELIFDLQ